ncbi:unnamed protein product [Parajaminaea phylloscopi]
MAAPTVEGEVISTPSSSTYPEWEDVPSAKPRKSIAPSFLVRLFSRFPLYTFHAESSSRASVPASRPILYVAPGESHTGIPTWASSEPESLRWQVELLFRGAGTQVSYEHLGPQSAWGPIPESLPFLQVAGKQLTTLGDDSLPTWMETNWPFEWEKAELGEGGALKEGPYPSLDVKQEASTWMVLLERSILAAVLLAQMTLDASAEEKTSPHTGPIFSRLLRSYLEGQRINRRAAKVANLVSASGDSGWASSVPTAGLSLTWIGFGASLTGAGTPQDGPSNESVGYQSWPEHLDSASVLEQGIQALAAVNSRFSERDQWFLGAEKPSSLDALLFALLHTILSLRAKPDTSQTSAAATLRKAVLDDMPRLVAYSRRTYAEYIKPMEMQRASQQ